jgi:5-hydroxyisourate hydrolase-like protein (transthyretin family)
MTDYKEIVTGMVVSRDTGKPVSGAEVSVYDKDLLSSDHLGSAMTGDDGRFAVVFTWSQYKDSVFEGRPDIFVKVSNPATEQTTKSKVFEELSGTLDDSDNETMDLGRIEVD